MTPRIIRPLADVEQTFIAQSKVLRIANLSVGNKIQYRNPSSSINNDQDIAKISSWKTTREWAQLLLDPLTWLLNNLPNLAAVVEDTVVHKSNFLRLETVDIEKLIVLVPIKTTSDFTAQAEEQVNITFDLEDKLTPLFRLLICPIEDEPGSFHLQYVLQHILGDGISCVVVMEKLIERLNVQARTISSLSDLDPNRSIIVPITTTKALMPPLEKLFNCKSSLYKIFRVAGWVLLPYFLKYKYWAGDVDVLDDFRNFPKMELLLFTQEETTQLLQAAKRKKCTLHTILQPALLFALKTVFMQHTNDGVNIGSPVNVRDLLPNKIPRDEQGNFTNYIGCYNMRVRDESEFWEMARVYRQDIEDVKTPHGFQDMMEMYGMIDLLPRKDGMWEGLIKNRAASQLHGRADAVLFSNLGAGWKEANKDQDSFLVQNAIFTPYSTITESAISMGIISANGVLSIVSSWSDTALLDGRERIKLYNEEMKKILLEATKDGVDQYFYKDAKKSYFEKHPSPQQL